MENIKVKVTQVTNRIAKTGREMKTLDITVHFDGGTIKPTHLMSDMPHPLPWPIIKRMKKFLEEWFENGENLEQLFYTMEHLRNTDFPKKMKISDYERFKIQEERRERKKREDPLAKYPKNSRWFTHKNYQHPYFLGKTAEGKKILYGAYFQGRVIIEGGKEVTYCEVREPLPGYLFARPDDKKNFTCHHYQTNGRCTNCPFADLHNPYTKVIEG